MVEMSPDRLPGCSVRAWRMKIPRVGTLSWLIMNSRVVWVCEECGFDGFLPVHGPLRKVPFQLVNETNVLCFSTGS